MERDRPILGFVHIPKTAGTTVKFILRNSTFFRHCDLQPLVLRGIFTNRDFRFMEKVFFFGLRSVAGHSLMHATERLSAPIHYFTFVRDPLKRCLSHYQQVKRARRRKGSDITFEDFMQLDDMANCQVRRIAGSPDLEKAIEALSSRYLFVGLTERFSESMIVLQRLCHYPLNLEYERLHVTKDNSAKQEVLDDPGSFRLLQETNELDKALYAFVRDELYPAFRKRAGVEVQELDEKDFLLTSYPLKYKLTRAYNQSVYRSLSKLRRWFK